MKNKINKSIKSIHTNSPINLTIAILLLLPIFFAACYSTKSINKETLSLNSNEKKSAYKIIGDVVNPDSSNRDIIKGIVVEKDRVVPATGAHIWYGKTDLETKVDHDGNFELVIPIDQISDADISIQKLGFECINLKLDEVKNKEVSVGVLSSERIVEGEFKGSCRDYRQDELKYASKIIGDIVNPDSLNSVIVKGNVFVEFCGEPLMGATIVYGKTSLGIVVDIDGAFKFTIPKDSISGADIFVKYIGYENLELKLDKVRNKEVKVVLAPSSVSLDKIEIIGKI